MPRGTVGELMLLEQHDVVLAHLGEPVGDAAAEDATADDDDAGAGGERITHRGQAFTRAFVGSYSGCKETVAGTRSPATSSSYAPASTQWASRPAGLRT